MAAWRRWIPIAAGLFLLLAGVTAIQFVRFMTARDYWVRVPFVRTRPSVYLPHALSLLQQSPLAARMNWEVVRAEAAEMARPAWTAAGTYPVIRHVMARMGDGESYLIPGPAPLPIQSQRLGMDVVFPENVVVAVQPGGPADRAGVKTGDVIERINGALPAGDPWFKGHIVDLTSRPDPARTDLTLRRSGESVPRAITVILTGAAAPLEPRGRRVDALVAMVDLPPTWGVKEYASKAIDAIRAEDSASTCGWMVDLRRGRGGSIWILMPALRPLLGEGTLGAFVARGGQRTLWTYRPDPPNGRPTPNHQLRRPDPPVAVLTSRLTADAHEAMAIAFRGRPLTRSFGEATYGLTARPEMFALPDRAMLILATTLEADRTGRVYDGSIAPDERVPVNWTSLGADDDPVIAAAARWLRDQPACRQKK